VGCEKREARGEVGRVGLEVGSERRSGKSGARGGK